MDTEIGAWATAIGLLLGGICTQWLRLRKDAREAKAAELEGAQKERSEAAAPWRNLYKGCEEDRKVLQARVDGQGETIAQLQHRLGRVEGTLAALRTPHPLGRRDYDGAITPAPEADHGYE